MRWLRPAKKAGGQVPVFIGPHRQLYLVAVAVGLGGPQNRQNRKLQFAQAGKGVLHKPGLGAAFRFIGNMPQPAAAAGPATGTVRLNPLWTGYQQFFQPAEGIAFHRLDDPHPGGIAWSRARNKDCLSVAVGYAVAVTGKGLDFQGKNLIFGNAMNTPYLSGSLPGSFSRVARYLLGGTPLTF